MKIANAMAKEEHMHESSLTRSMCVGNTFASEYITDD